MPADLSTLRLLAIVRLPVGTVPAPWRRWYHIEWFGRAKWIAGNTLSTGSGWKYWDDLLGERRTSRINMTYTDAVHRLATDQGIKPQEPTPEELRFLADPATWRLHASHQKEVVTCPICHLDYLYPDQHRIHVRLHTQWIAATRVLGYEPAGQSEQEQIRRHGQQLLAEGHLEAGAMLIIQARFHHSLTKAIREGYWTQHPTLEQYVAMVDGWNDIPEAAWREVHQHYGYVAREIYPGEWQWVSKTD